MYTVYVQGIIYNNISSSTTTIYLSIYNITRHLLPRRTDDDTNHNVITTHLSGM